MSFNGGMSIKDHQEAATSTLKSLFHIINIHLHILAKCITQLTLQVIAYMAVPAALHFHLVSIILKAKIANT